MIFDLYDCTERLRHVITLLNISRQNLSDCIHSLTLAEFAILGNTPDNGLGRRCLKASMSWSQRF